MAHPTLNIHVKSEKPYDYCAPERALIAAIVQLAAEDIKNVSVSEVDYLGAINFIKRERGAFDSFCLFLDIDPAAARERLLKLNDAMADERKKYKNILRARSKKQKEQKKIWRTRRLERIANAVV